MVRPASSVVHAVCFLGTCVITPPAMAQWKAIRLHSSAFSGSVAGAVWGDWQGGTAGIGQSKPILWHSSSKEWINLAPGPGLGGGIFGMHENRQVGYVNGHASLWSGTPESRVDLHPSWAEGSFAYGVWGDEQVGYTYVGSGNNSGRAALWRGSAASYVNLHPGGTAVSSVATAVAAGQQGGRIEFPYPGGGTIPHAALWSGTPGSFVDMNPPGATSSGITSMWPGQQVGNAGFPGIGGLAGYWSGTPESFVSLQPPNVTQAVILGTCGSAQAGYAYHMGAWSAAAWFGTAESFVNLHLFLPPGQYYQSTAGAVSFHDGLYSVVGSATSITGSGEAWLWVGVPAPGSAAVLLTAGALAARRRSRG